MQVSVILPIYNGSRTIRETVESILNQSYKNLELIIVNDGSTDDSEKIIKSFNDSRIKYYKVNNSGSPAKPRNFGIRKAKGNFIAFCDQDDIWYENKLEKQINEYKSSKKIGIIVSSADFINKDGDVIDGNYLEEKYLPSEKARNSLLSSNFITACSSLVPKNVIDEIGMLNENLTGVDDYEYWLRITKKYGVLKIKEPLCAWRRSKGALSESKTDLYLENEKIFIDLENNEKNESVVNAHTKNLNRIFVSSIMENKIDITKKTINSLKIRENSKKAQLMIFIYLKNNTIGITLIKRLYKLRLIKI